MQKGFTLIQISILLVVASLVLVSVLPSSRTNLNANQSTTNRMNGILTALRGYEATHASLPCPADASQPIGSNSYGVAAANPGTGSPGNCTGGSPAANYADTPNNVAVGMVPVRTLGLSNDYALDAFGRDITYAVDTSSTVCFSGTLPGKITVTDNGIPGSTIAALVSHGADGHGAWIPLTGNAGSAVRFNAGSADVNTLLNAHVNAGFTPTTPLTNFVRTMPTATFDDLLVYKSNLWSLNAAPVASAPLLPGITPPANGTYGTGQHLTFTVTFSNAVAVTGTPEIALTVPQLGGGNATRYATYTGSSGNTATFTYTVLASDYAPSGISMASPSIVLNGGTLSVAGISACLTFSPPNLSGIIIAQQQFIYVADTNNQRIEQFDPTGAFLSYIASGVGNVYGVAADTSGNVYAIIYGGIYKFSPTGTQLMAFGSAGSGNGQFSGYPQALALDAGGNIYVSDTNNNRVQKFSPAGSYLQQFAITRPGALAVDYSGNLFAANTTTSVVDEFNAAGTLLQSFGAQGGGNGQFGAGGPLGLALDACSNLWFSDTNNSRMEEFTNAGAYASQFGASGSGNGQFNNLSGSSIALDGSGNIWVLDRGNSRVQKFNSSGAYQAQFGTYGAGSSQFNMPLGIAITGAPNGGACVTSVTPPANAAYTTGQTLTFTVTYNAAVTITGTPQLVLTIGANTRYANYLSGSGTSTLTFTYTIQASDTATGMAMASSINLNGGTISSSGVGANLNFTPPAMGGLTINATSFLIVADSGNNRVQKLDIEGNFISQIGCASGACSTSSVNGKFNNPADVALDGSGNIWVTDEGNHRVEEFNSSGTYLLGIGAGYQGVTGSVGNYGTVNGQFNHPVGINIDGTGNVWVVDSYNHRVEEFSSSGAYEGQLGTTGAGGCTPSHFEDISYITFDSSGNIYVSDGSGCNQIEEFTSGGTYIKTFGTVIANYGSLNAQNGLAFDACGDMWIQDTGNNKLVETDYAGNYLQSVSNSFGMQNLAIAASGNIYSFNATAGDFTIYNSGGTLLSTIGSSGSGSGHFNGTGAFIIAGSSVTRLPITGCPAVILAASGPSAGNYVTGGTLGFAVTYDQPVTVTGTPYINVPIGTNTRQASYLSGSGTTTLTFQYTIIGADYAPGGITGGSAITLNGGTISSNSIGSGLNFTAPSLPNVNINGVTYLYAIDQGNHRVEYFNLSGNYLGQWGSNGSGNGQFANPRAFPGVDAGGNVWVPDESSNNRMQKFTSTGTYLSQFGSAGSGSGQFGTSSPTGVAFDSSGNLWVIDQTNNRIEEFNSSGTYLGQIGCASGACSTSSANGKFNSPFGIAIDSSNNIWVLDSANNRVEKFNSSGTFLLSVGGPSPYTCEGSPSGSSPSCAAGLGNGQFNAPVGIAVDASNNIWVGDSTNNRVEEFNSSGTYLMSLGTGYNGVGGSIGSTGSGNGQLHGVRGLALDWQGNVWVADGGNSRIEEYSSSGTYLNQTSTTSGSGNNQFSGLFGIAIR